MIILLSIVLILVLIIVAGLQHFRNEYKSFFEEVDKQYETISNINLDSIPDGVYREKYGKIPVYVDLSVSIVDHRIDTIIINKQSSGPGYEALDMIKRIINKQKVRVDAVSGATISSKCIMIAADKALREKRDDYKGLH